MKVIAFFDIFDKDATRYCYKPKEPICLWICLYNTLKFACKGLYGEMW